MGKFKEMDLLRQEREQALDKMAENARELGLNYDTPLSAFVRSSDEAKAEVMERVIDKAIEAQKKVQPAPVQEPVASEVAPPNSLPSWDECALRVRNSDFFEDRVAAGGYGPEPDSLTANALHRFIYEYDDADSYRSAWFLHRLEQVINELTPPAAQPSPVPLTREQREEVCIKAEQAMAADPNLSWRIALITQTEAAHGITKGGERG